MAQGDLQEEEEEEEGKRGKGEACHGILRN
jgi:hypothetical protein